MNFFIWDFVEPICDVLVFFHWLKLKCSLIAKLILSSITLLILPSSFFAGFINLTCALLAKLSLWSFNMKKQLFSSLTSKRFRILLFLKICLPTDHIDLLLGRVVCFFVSSCECSGKKFLISFFA